MIALVLAVATLATGFDHGRHDRDVDVSGGAAVPCVRCHAERGGRPAPPGHAACFGSCHGAAPVAPRKGGKLALPADRLVLCTACHAEAALAQPYTGKLAVPYPPYTLAADYALVVGHKVHARVACTQCHPGGNAPYAGPPHQRCAGCHDGGADRGPTMAACTTCHQRATGKPEPPRLAVARDSVEATISHARHASRGAARDCTTCHAAIRDSDSSELPRPTVQTCAIAGCHDGRAAFATTARCTPCHAKAPARYQVARPDARFSHASHASAIAALTCTSCHRLTAHGEVVVAGHAACASCHADDFAARRPRICGGCHAATEPWRPLVADRAPPARTEFGATLDHDRHPGDCARCHALRTASAQLRPPRGHAACTGAGCHAPTGGPPPTLAACTDCHRLGLVAARIAARTADPWSVRATFDHAVHQRDRAGAALACTSCHRALGARSIVELPAPAKATCATCHDGDAAFKLTGTTCTRCHGGARS